MNPWLQSPISRLNREAFLSDEVEVLQTDVMRFFAIMCLCLMAIFALVKTLPMAPVADHSAPPEPEQTEAGAAAAKKQISALRATLAELKVQTRTAAADVVKSSGAAAEAQKKEQEALTKLAKARQEFEILSDSLQESRNTLKAREMRLTEIATDLENKQRIQSALQSHIEDETRQLAELKAERKTGKAESDRHLTEQNTETKTADGENLPQQPVGQGFTLRFASDAALQQLIGRQKVNFYALAGKNSWLLNLKNGQPIYSPSRFPHQIYEMQTHTVPIEYSEAFQRQVAALGGTEVTWGVTLPPQTEVSIKRLINRRKGGELIIGANGEVAIN